MRLNEICQLRYNDVERVDGVLCIRIDDRVEGQRIKREESSRRLIPVHPQLLDIGFHKLIDGKNEKDDWLFSDLKFDSRGYRSDGFQKWFRRFQEKVGTYSPKTTFHSFRHTWRDAARNARIPDETADAIGGWRRDGTSSRYGAGASQKVLLEEIRKIEFPGVDLSHLA